MRFSEDGRFGWWVRDLITNPHTTFILFMMNSLTHTGNDCAQFTLENKTKGVIQ